MTQSDCSHDIAGSGNFFWLAFEPRDTTLSSCGKKEDVAVRRQGAIQTKTFNVALATLIMSQMLGSIDQSKLFIETTGNLHTTGRIENGIIHLTIAQRAAGSPLLSTPSCKPNFNERELIIDPVCSSRYSF